MPTEPFTSITASRNDYTDSRERWDWKTRYPPDARRCINNEAITLGTMLLLVVLLSAACFGLSGQPIVFPIKWLSSSHGAELRWQIDTRIVAVFCSGWVGGTTFAIKWLVHAVAKGTWHLDRRYWRLLVPPLGGVYACVVLTLFDAGIFGHQQTTEPRNLPFASALAFLVGYFSDGVSGLLSNIANAVFGTLEKK